MNGTPGFSQFSWFPDPGQKILTQYETQQKHFNVFVVFHIVPGSAAEPEM